LEQLLRRISCFGFGEVLVVDSAPSRPAVELAQAYQARYLVERVPGLSRARNRALKAATFETVLFFEDDGLPGEGWPDELLVELADSRVGLVIGSTHLPTTTSEEVRAAYATAGFVPPQPQRRVLDQHMPEWFAQANFGALGIGCTMAIRRNVIEHWSGFDERIGSGTILAGHEDHRAFSTLISLGWTVVYTPGAVIHHPVEYRSPEQLRKRAIQAVAAAAGYLFLLFCEEPGHRGDLFRHFQSKMRCGTREFSRTRSNVSRLRILAARLQGLYRYARTRLNYAHGNH
jgi:glycosyltransferase involved in cell wall biosynthesis